jgi:hypothetical protein
MQAGPTRMDDACRGGESYKVCAACWKTERMPRGKKQEGPHRDTFGGGLWASPSGALTRPLQRERAKVVASVLDVRLAARPRPRCANPLLTFLTATSWGGKDGRSRETGNLVLSCGRRGDRACTRHACERDHRCSSCPGNRPGTRCARRLALAPGLVSQHVEGSRLSAQASRRFDSGRVGSGGEGQPGGASSWGLGGVPPRLDLRKRTRAVRTRHRRGPQQSSLPRRSLVAVGARLAGQRRTGAHMPKWISPPAEPQEKDFSFSPHCCP